MEGISTLELLGIEGEFTVGELGNQTRIKFIETKIKPGKDGRWENMLANSMVPWRETFDIEKISFDELLQRDLDDSRVAHELIPYLINKDGNSARFFPPILAVLVPNSNDGHGINKYYPKPNPGEGKNCIYGDLFETLTVEREPFCQLNFNAQKTSFIIVDGQHRAMAVLALHRQMNTWNNDIYKTFYNHIKIEREQISNLELPVCLIYFPDLHEDNTEIIQKGFDLEKACREIFLVVNRQAQPVSNERVLLLDDDDFAAKMMRKTLSDFKDRSETELEMARIYSIQYSESENKGKAVADSNHYCTSEAINKFHGISSFGDVRGFDMIEPSDISNANFHKNPERPAAILVGTSQESITSLSKNSCKNFSPPISDEIIKLLSKINNELIFSLFDIFWPFTTTNRTLRNLKIKLEGADLQAHIPAKKTYNIMFDGSNARPVFFKHHDRLKEIYKENPNNDYIKNQLENNKSIINYLTTTEEDLQNEKCCNLFKIDYEYFFKNSDDKHNEKKIITKKAQSIFNTVSTQAFQIGYLMSILTIVEKLIDTESDTHVKYEKRLNYVNISTKLIISCLNNFFTPDINGKTKSLSILNKSKFNIFNTEELGLRSFHRLFVDELNEKQWVFFRYTIYEIIFSKHNIQFLIDHINEIDDESIKLNLKDILISLIDEIDLLRDDFIENACSAQLNKQDFKTYLNTESGRLEGANKDVKEIQTHLYDLKEKKKLETAKICNSNIKKSLGSVNTFENAKNELLTKI